MSYRNEELSELEKLDPVAYPHHPIRPRGAARPIYTVLDEMEGEATNNKDDLSRQVLTDR